MKKLLASIIIIMLVTVMGISLAYRKNIEPECYYNNIHIVGINVERKLISYYTEKKNLEKGDVKFQYIIFDYSDNNIIASSQECYIASLYSEENIQTDFEDEKYSYRSYYNFKKSEIDKLNLNYKITLEDFKAKNISNYQFIKYGTKEISQLIEDTNYRISFSYMENGYEFEKSESNVCKILNVRIPEVYIYGDYMILVIEKKHISIESDQFYDYELYGIKK